MSRKSRLILFLAIASPFLLTVSAVEAQAQGRARGGDRDGGHGGRSGVVVRGGFPGSFYYDPFWYDPFWGPYQYGYPYYSDTTEVRVHATPKDAEVYVDGYYAGIVDNFNGIIQGLNVRPGGHEFVLYRDGFQTVRQTAYLQPGSTFTLQYTMVPLAPGQTTEPRPVPAAQPGPAYR